MNRREFFKRAALIAAGVVAADQLELLERLAHKKVWAGHSFEPRAFMPVIEVLGPGGYYAVPAEAITGLKHKGPVYMNEVVQVDQAFINRFYKYGHPITDAFRS